MKKVYVCLMALFFTLPLVGVVFPVFAQDPSGDHQPPSAADIIAKMQSKLNLIQDQVNAITPIIEKYSAKRQELRQSIDDGTGDKDSKRSQMKQIKADEKQVLAQLLSSDQMAQFEQMMSQHRHKNSSGGTGDGKGE